MRDGLSTKTVAVNSLTLLERAMLLRLEDAKAIIHANILNSAVVVTEHGPNGRVIQRIRMAAYLKWRD